MTVDMGKLVRIVMALSKEDAPLEWSDLDSEPVDRETLVDWWLHAKAYAAAAKRVVDLMDSELVDVLGSGSVTHGGYRVFVSTVRTDEKCVDHPRFLAWLAEHPEVVGDVVSPNSVKKAQLPPAARETFFEKVRVERMQAEPVAVDERYL